MPVSSAREVFSECVAGLLEVQFEDRLVAAQVRCGVKMTATLCDRLCPDRFRHRHLDHGRAGCMLALGAKP